jgi:thioredoxin-dependent peroxiredoxin
VSDENILEHPMTLSIGDNAPDFDLPTYSDQRLSSKDLKGQAFVLYFYPKDMTPGCTTESKDFRDSLKDFEDAGVVVVGASKDSPARHDKFKAKQNLNFPLLADESGTLCEAYGVWQLKKFMGREFMGIVRTTFLIDGDGIIRQIWPKVRVKRHVEDVLEAAKSM